MNRGKSFLLVIGIVGGVLAGLVMLVLVAPSHNAVVTANDLNGLLQMELSCYSFSKISYFLERVLMEDIDKKDSLDSKLQTYYICPIKIRSRK